MESLGKSYALDGEVGLVHFHFSAWIATPSALALAAGAFASIFPAVGFCGEVPTDFGRYEIIVEKFPFGAPPPSQQGAVIDGSGLSSTAATASSAEGGAENPIAAPVKLSSVSRFGGIPAAGLTDAASGVSFVLRPGEAYAGYRLIDLDTDLGKAVVASGTNEWLIGLSWATGQPTNIVPSAREPYFTAFRPGWQTGSERVESEPKTLSAAAMPKTSSGVFAIDTHPPKTANSVTNRAFGSLAISPEEEAALVAKATVKDPDGSTHVSFRELNRLRSKLKREKAEAARAAEIAADEERRAESARLARIATDERNREEAESSELAKTRRRAVIEAIARGYDIGEEVELTEEEADELRQAGFQVPE